ncbi:MCE family protein [uncultured Jatrophihabitans sp.]|uniref:MCE family protein n=1 Tax=uncultured Jatrophihabitans sp. TaxID=1610747 RepID=UPI0035CA198D
MRGLLSPLIKLVAFLVVTAVATYVLAATISNTSYGSAKTYHAEFTDVSGLELGDDVRIAGVRVGTVDNIALERGKHGKDSFAEVAFTVQESSAFGPSKTLPANVQAYLRYRNLVGQRYLDIEQGPPTTKTLTKTLPIKQTHPAVDLTTLFNGFQPLTQGLAPNALNQLSLEIVQTLQGEGGAFEQLLSNVASLTNALADKDAVIGDVIKNLSGVLGAIAGRDTELSALISNLASFLHGLANDRNTIGNAIDGVNDLTTSTAGLLTRIRPPLAADIKSTTGLLALLNRNTGTVKYVLQQFAPTVGALIRTASYGSWFNFYICSLTGKLTLGTQTSDVNLANTGGAGSRCK